MAELPSRTHPEISAAACGGALASAAIVSWHGLPQLIGYASIAVVLCSARCGSAGADR